MPAKYRNLSAATRRSLTDDMAELRKLVFPYMKNLDIHFSGHVPNFGTYRRSAVDRSIVIPLNPGQTYQIDNPSGIQAFSKQMFWMEVGLARFSYWCRWSHRKMLHEIGLPESHWLVAEKIIVNRMIANANKSIKTVGNVKIPAMRWSQYLGDHTVTGRLTSHPMSIISQMMFMDMSVKRTSKTRESINKIILFLEGSGDALAARRVRLCKHFYDNLLGLANHFSNCKVSIDSKNTASDVMNYYRSFVAQGLYTWEELIGDSSGGGMIDPGGVTGSFGSEQDNTGEWSRGDASANPFNESDESTKETDKDARAESSFEVKGRGSDGEMVASKEKSGVAEQGAESVAGMGGRVEDKYQIGAESMVRFFAGRGADSDAITEYTKRKNGFYIDPLIMAPIRAALASLKGTAQGTNLEEEPSEEFDVMQVALRQRDCYVHRNSDHSGAIPKVCVLLDWSGSMTEEAAKEKWRSGRLMGSMIAACCISVHVLHALEELHFQGRIILKQVHTCDSGPLRWDHENLGHFSETYANQYFMSHCNGEGFLATCRDMVDEMEWADATILLTDGKYEANGLKGLLAQRAKLVKQFCVSDWYRAEEVAKQNFPAYCIAPTLETMCLRISEIG